MNRKKNQDYSYTHQYERLFNLLGKGRMGYCVLGCMFVTMINLLLLLLTVFDAASSLIYKTIVISGSISLLLNLLYLDAFEVLA